MFWLHLYLHISWQFLLFFTVFSRTDFPLRFTHALPSWCAFFCILHLHDAGLPLTFHTFFFFGVFWGGSWFVLVSIPTVPVSSTSFSSASLLKLFAAMLFSYSATGVAQQLFLFDGPGIESSHNARNFSLLRHEIFFLSSSYIWNNNKNNKIIYWALCACKILNIVILCWKGSLLRLSLL